MPDGAALQLHLAMTLLAAGCSTAEGVVLRRVQRTTSACGAWSGFVRLFVASQVPLGAAVVWLLGVVLLAWWTRRTLRHPRR